MKAIRVTSEAEFERLLDHVADQASQASDQWNHLKAMDAAIEEYGQEMWESRAFWGITFEAYRETVVSSLNRLYDQHPGALSLGNFLETVRSCSAYFSVEAFKKRLSNNRYVHRLAEQARAVDMAALDVEIESVSTSDAVVSRLWSLRNRYVSHREANLVRLGKIPSLIGLGPEEFETLVERATAITNKYNGAYRAAFHSSRVVGWDDYKHLLNDIRAARNARIAKIKAENRAFEALADGGQSITESPH